MRIIGWNHSGESLRRIIAENHCERSHRSVSSGCLYLCAYLPFGQPTKRTSAHRLRSGELKLLSIAKIECVLVKQTPTVQAFVQQLCASKAAAFELVSCLHKLDNFTAKFNTFNLMRSNLTLLTLDGDARTSLDAPFDRCALRQASLHSSRSSHLESASSMLTVRVMILNEYYLELRRVGRTRRGPS